MGERETQMAGGRKERERFGQALRGERKWRGEIKENVCFFWAQNYLAKEEKKTIFGKINHR